VLAAQRLRVHLRRRRHEARAAAHPIPRTDLAQQWAAAPHWISSFADGALQFGPLHLYLVGAALKVGVSKQRAGPLTSLVFGTLTVLPLAALSRRLELPVEILNPFRHINVDTRKFDPEYLSEIMPEMAVAVGLAMRGV
jgi:hypothetical protein